MPPPVTIRPDCDDIQIAGYVPRWMELPSGLIGDQRTVRIAPERIQHIKLRRPAWWRFCLEHTPNTLRHPDFAGQRTHGDQRRVEFVRLVGHPGRWLVVSVKFLDDRAEAWVNSAHPIARAYLTRRIRAGTMWSIRGP